MNGDKLHDIIIRVVVSDLSEESQYLIKTQIKREEVRNYVIYILS